MIQKHGFVDVSETWIACWMIYVLVDDSDMDWLMIQKHGFFDVSETWMG